MAGLSVNTEILIGKAKIRDDLLFTHFGIGGPAAYRATLFGEQNITINFAPDINVFDLLKQSKTQNGKKSVRLDALASNTPAHKIYEALGFQYRGKQHLYAENTGWTDFFFFELKD